MKRIIAAALLVMTVLLPLACSTSGRYDNEPGRERSTDRMVEDKFLQEKATASNPGT